MTLPYARCQGILIRVIWPDIQWRRKIVDVDGEWRWRMDENLFVSIAHVSACRPGTPKTRRPQVEAERSPQCDAIAASINLAPNHHGRMALLTPQSRRAAPPTGTSPISSSLQPYDAPISSILQPYGAPISSSSDEGFNVSLRTPQNWNFTRHRKSLVREFPWIGCNFEFSQRFTRSNVIEVLYEWEWGCT